MSRLVEFLVNVEIDTGDLDTTVVDQLRAAEARRARELAADGSIDALWRIEGRWANAGIWRAPDEDALLRKLDSLPLRPYMRIEWARLSEHPSDPRLTCKDDTTAKPARGRIPLDPLPSLSPRTRGGSVRRGRTELAALPVLPVRARGERRTALLAPASTRRYVDTVERITGRIEVDVTSVGGCEDAVPAIVQCIVAAARSLPATCVASSGFACVSGQVLPDARPSSDDATVIGLAHSGCHDGVEIRRESDDHDLDIHIGPVTPRVVARSFGGGDDVMVLRRLVTVDAASRSARLSSGQIASLLGDVKTRIDQWVAERHRRQA
ncbi:muconolactone Delta-isomerase family protein [Streptomyces sp. NBC_00063]|uniref:muconolactone Delta-isomerase family protein n=1 Tax=Streptomyces sp. NBC_00063 TaxID=2975638 RepID=UPI003D70847D